MTEQRYGIRRSDGRWYVGTVDREAIFTTAPPGVPADEPIVATFTELAAKRRLRGLRKAEKHGRTFEVLPIGDVHAG